MRAKGKEGEGRESGVGQSILREETASQSWIGSHRGSLVIGTGEVKGGRDCFI